MNAKCEICGTEMVQRNYSEVRGSGYDRPLRIDYDWVCPVAPAEHPTRHVIETLGDR